MIMTQSQSHIYSMLRIPFFFCEVKKLEMQYGNVSVLLFEALSGVHISISRSVNEVAIVDLEFWIMVYASSLNPLDLPMEAKYKVAEVWNRVIEKVEKKLAI